MEWIEFGGDIDAMKWVLGVIVVGLGIWFFIMTNIE